MRHLALSTLVLLSMGCADRLGTAPVDASLSDAGPFTGEGIPPRSGAFAHTVEDGRVGTVVDATSTSDWRHLDLDSGESVDAAEGWELSFSRFRVRINGGVSGTGGVQVAELDGVSFESVMRAPEDGWTVPVPDGEADDDTEADNAFNNGQTDWFDYEVETHTLTPRDVTYVVASTEGRFFKLRFDGYYDEAGSPAVVQFRWAAIEPPEMALPDAGPSGPVDAGPDASSDGGVDTTVPGDALDVNAGDGAAWVYLSVADGVVSPADPSVDTGWDIAFRRTAVRSNSGTSGPGMAGAQVYDETLAFDDIEDVDTFGFAVDTLIDSGAPGAEIESLNGPLLNWYDYDPVRHAVSPTDQTYLLRTASGGYARMRIWTWEDGHYAMSLHGVERRVVARTLSVDVTEADRFVSVRDGAVVEDVSEPMADSRWDLWLSSSAVRTNGGTSGTAEAGVTPSEATTLTGLGTAPSDGYAVDAEGNPALADWHTGDGGTSRGLVYFLRAADGTYGALRVVSQVAGVYTLELAYAGPENTDFGDL
ncbi:MAG: HmuY family protein [Sandaracinaceae bacterium]